MSGGEPPGSGRKTSDRDRHRLEETPAVDTDVTPGGPTPNVLCAGHVNWDVTIHVARLPEPDGEVTIDRLQQAGGGSAANVATGLVGIGSDASVYGSVGGDESGALTLRELANAGVDPGYVLVDAESSTSMKYLIVDADGEVMVLANAGANESFSAADLDQSAFDGLDHLHLTSQRPETAAALATAAAERGISCSFDPGRQVGERDYAATLRATDLLFVNEREADLVAETTGIDPWNPTDRVVAIKLGGDGATVRTPNGAASHPGFPIAPVDTTGTGDAFAAGFLAVVLRNTVDTDGSDSLSTDPRDYQLPLLVGNACGAIAATEVAARADLSWLRIRETMGEAPERDLLIEV